MPVPGKKVTTPFKRKGKHWRACGWHTGVDFAAPAGAKVVAARPGKVVHVNFGSAFGRHQFVVIYTSGKTADFYAHTTTRPPNGARVKAGQAIAKVGKEGNVTGPHLHFERLALVNGKPRWSCSLVRDPAASLQWKA